jgi:hypothetical protein
MSERKIVIQESAWSRMLKRFRQWLEARSLPPEQRAGPNSIERHSENVVAVLRRSR